jgi:hypothetical protein
MPVQVRATKREEWPGVIVNPGDKGVAFPTEPDPDRKGRTLVLWSGSIRASWCDPEMLEDL